MPEKKLSSNMHTNEYYAIITTGREIILVVIIAFFLY